MTKYEKLQEALVKHETSVDEYWSNLADLALEIREGFADYLGLDPRSEWIEPISSQVWRYVEAMHWREKDTGYDERELVVLKNGRQVSRNGKSLRFVIVLTLESPHNTNFKKQFPITLNLSRDGESFSAVIEEDQDYQPLSTDPKDRQHESSLLFASMLRVVKKQLDASEYE